MPIKFRCPKCKKELTVKDEMAGKQGKCPGCKGAITVPSAASVTTKAAPLPKKKPVEEDDEVVAAEAVDDDVVSAEVVDDEEDAPVKKRKSRRDEDDEDDDDDRGSRSRAKRKSSRREDEDEDDEDDDRPARKKRPASRRRDDDEDDYEDDEPRKQNPKKRRAAFRRASLGVFLNFIGTCVCTGAFLFAIIASLVEAGQAASIISSLKAGKFPSPPSDGFLKILSYLGCLVFLGGFITSTVGAALTITTPTKRGEIGLSIASTATMGVGLIFLLILLINGLFSGGGGGASRAFYLLFFAYNPFLSFREGFFQSGGFGVYFLGWLTIGNMVCFGLYQWAAAKSQKDRSTAGKAFLGAILAPSIAAGAGLIVWILMISIKQGGVWTGAIIWTFYCLAVMGSLAYHAMVMLASRAMMEDAE